MYIQHAYIVYRQKTSQQIYMVVRKYISQFNINYCVHNHITSLWTLYLNDQQLLIMLLQCMGICLIMNIISFSIIIMLFNFCWKTEKLKCRQAKRLEETNKRNITKKIKWRTDFVVFVIVLLTYRDLAYTLQIHRYIYNGRIVFLSKTINTFDLKVKNSI